MKGKKPGDAVLLLWRVVLGWILLALIEINLLDPSETWFILAGLAGICLGIPPIALRWVMDVWVEEEEVFTYHKIGKPGKAVGAKENKYTFIGYVKEIFK